MQTFFISKAQCEKAINEYSCKFHIEKEVNHIQVLSFACAKSYNIINSTCN